MKHEDRHFWISLLSYDRCELNCENRSAQLLSTRYVDENPSTPVLKIDEDWGPFNSCHQNRWGPLNVCPENRWGPLNVCPENRWGPLNFCPWFVTILSIRTSQLLSSEIIDTPNLCSTGRKSCVYIPRRQNTGASTAVLVSWPAERRSGLDWQHVTTG